MLFCIVMLHTLCVGVDTCPAYACLLFTKGLRPLPLLLCSSKKCGRPHLFAKVQDHSRDTTCSRPPQRRDAE